MFLIYGWGHTTTKDYGPTVPTTCRNCHNQGYWHLVHVRVWFTLFFIPAIPYRSNYYLLCQVCSRGVELNGDQIAKAKEIGQATTAYLNKAMTQEAYLAVLNTKQLTA